jgi:hypothetical protein
MPKVVSSLYNHKAQDVTVRHLNVSTAASGHSSYLFNSSEVPIAPVVPAPHPQDEDEHQYYAAAGMDIDFDEPIMENGETVEVVTGVHIAPTKAKRYRNLVSLIVQWSLPSTDSTI